MSQIKSKERVAERGEVFTAEREVNAMCDLVANECLRPDSRFLEPACGDGNFLAVILKRKLAELRRKYKKSPRDYEKQAIVAIGSLYGVDIMNDNVIACRERLYKIWNEEYSDHCKSEASDETREAAKFIISRNIINGNALTLMCVDAEGKDTSAPIVFSEWTLIGGSQMQRSDYTMSDLLLYNDNSEGNLFALTEEQKEEGGIFLRRYISQIFYVRNNIFFKLLICSHTFHLLSHTYMAFVYQQRHITYSYALIILPIERLFRCPHPTYKAIGFGILCSIFHISRQVHRVSVLSFYHTPKETSLIPTVAAKSKILTIGIGASEFGIYLMLINLSVLIVSDRHRSAKIPLQLNAEELRDRCFINSSFHLFLHFSFYFYCFSFHTHGRVRARARVAARVSRDR